MSLFMGLILASCNDDDDYTIFNEPILTEDSVATGSADCTATTATLHATVDGLQNASPSSYAVGFYYGYSENALTETASGTLEDGVITAELTGLTENTVIYYQAFVTLQRKVTFRGDIKSLVTTDTRVTTLAPQGVTAAVATLGGSVTGAPADAAFGVVIATAPDDEKVRAGLIVPAEGAGSDFSFAYAGLAPNTTYYYAAYADLGSGIVYGEVQPFTTSAMTIDLDNDLIDLGLSVKWARFNVGATAENELGGRFGYGEKTGVSNSIDLADYASADIYRTDRDIANSAWSGSVTLPTAADFEELFSRCQKEWTEVDGVAGYKLTGPNGNSIFLPAAGSRTINTVDGAGVNGLYATGSINGQNNQFAVSFRFDAAGSSRTSTPCYQALSVRPVSTARNAVFNKELLYKTWEIDLNEGKSSMFNGPVWFYGTADSWRTVSNNEPIVGDSWLWDADASNTWAFGDCTGYMTFNPDGTIVVKNQNGDEVTGKYTIDEAEKTITADVDLLAPDNFVAPMVQNRKTAIKILSLSDDKFQLGYYRDSEPATLSVNLIPQTKKYGFPVTLLCVGGDWNGTWGDEVGNFMSADLDGVHTFTYNGSCSSAMVFTLDVAGLRKAFPNSIVAIKEIRCDGKAIRFDANKFFYGDIENNGNFRVELFNIWGKGATAEQVSSPFSSVVSNTDPAFSFNSTLEFDYVIVTEPKFTPNLITINPSWGGDWAYNQGASFNIVVDENSKLAIDNPSFDITLNGTDFADGSIMTFIQVDNLFSYFPQTKATFDALHLDGKLVSGYDASKIVNTNDGGAYRLELWNMYGSTSANGCAFGTPGENGAIAALGFSQSMRTQFTFNSLFDKVEW